MTDGASASPSTIDPGYVAQLIIEHAREFALFMLDLDGRITSWSPGAERITGYTEAEAIGMPFSVLYIEPDITAGHDRRELEIASREGRCEDSRWHRRKSGERFWANGVTMAVHNAGMEGFIKVFRDETRTRLAEEQRVLLLNELNHRINNTLVTVQSLVEQTLRAMDVDRQARDNLSERLMALARAHKVLVEQNWAGAELGAIVDQALAPFQQREGAFHADGPPLRLSPQQAVSMSLVVHELITNAVKYGALSTTQGRVSITWNLYLDGAGARHMTFLWQESGGPPVQSPAKVGFGTRLIERSFAQESGGRTRLVYDPAGVRCVVELRLSRAEETPTLDIAKAAQAADGADPRP